jgi:hypothetical protein
MFGRLHTVTAGDQRIIILDGQAFAVRSYDFSGEFLAAWPLLLHVDGEFVVTGDLNDEGVYEVKRYRLVVPN